jgi:hypothetical protein
MRSEVLAYLKTLALGSFTVSDELPRNESGTPLYLKNLRKIYVDQTQYDQTPILRTLNGNFVHSNTQTIPVVFSADAKQLPANYDDLINLIRAAEDIKPEQGFNDRNSTVVTEIENDVLITTVELTYTNIR